MHPVKVAKWDFAGLLWVGSFRVSYESFNAVYSGDGLLVEIVCFFDVVKLHKSCT